jgi:hypothetical protein
MIPFLHHEVYFPATKMINLIRIKNEEGQKENVIIYILVKMTTSCLDFS